MSSLQDLKQITDGLALSARMPVLFVGHGNPMNAIEHNEYHQQWATLGKALPRPKAILCISAHWQTNGTQVTMMEHPRTIHDFGGFPQELFNVQYPAAGNPELAQQTRDLIRTHPVGADFNWGLDHGCWSVLSPMYPDASIPVIQLSLDLKMSPSQHYALAQELGALRSRGVLLMGSGNIVHNLRMVQWQEGAYDWAVEFDEQVKSLIEKGDDDSLIHYEKLGQAARLSVPTNEHYLPLLYALALRDSKDRLEFFNAKTTMGSVSMRSMIFS